MQRSAAMAHLLHEQRGHDAGHNAQEHLRNTSGPGFKQCAGAHMRDTSLLSYP